MPAVSDDRPDDRALVTRAKAGEFAAFEALVTRYERRVYSVAIHILRRRHDAEDVVQTVFLSALEHIGEFREEASFATWITRIAVNASLKVLRKRKGLPTVSLAPSADDERGEIPHPQYVAPWRDDPARIAERKDIEQILDEAIAGLPEGHRVVFVLRDVEEMSVRETAEALGISEANVKVRLLRARLALREKLTRIFGDETKRVLAVHDHEGGDSTAVEALLRSYESR